MRILENHQNDNLKDYIEKTTFNDNPYSILLFFEKRDNPSIFLPISWPLVNSLSYIDDIFSVGVVGEITIDNKAGVLNEFLSATDIFYVGFYLRDEVTGIEENIYFSIVESSPVGGTTSSGSFYKLVLQEAFIVESANKNISLIKGLLFKSEEASDETTTHFHDLALKMYKMLGVSIQNNVSNSDKKRTQVLIEDKSIFRTIQLDEDSIEKFRKHNPTNLLGEALNDNITSKTTIQEFLGWMNVMFYIPRAETDIKVSLSDAGIPASIRSENVSYIDKDKFNQKGRRIILKSQKETFENCFSNNFVFEIIGGKSYKDMSSNFLVPETSIYDIALFPINTNIINNIWCDYLITPLNQGDAYTSYPLILDDVINYFERDFLKNKATINFNILKGESQGIVRKDALFGNINFNYCVGTKMLRTFFTLNKMLKLTIAGQVYRKANELTVIDISNETILDNPEQATFSNLVTDKVYFVTRVIHNFTGQKYVNETYNCAFCKLK